MNDPRSKAERSRAKDLRQGLPQREVIHGKPKKVDKPYRVFQRHIWVGEGEKPNRTLFFNEDWRYILKKFVSAELANQYIEKELRCWRFHKSYRVEFEVRNG
jgi:hypothetical protein